MFCFILEKRVGSGLHGLLPESIFCERKFWLFSKFGLIYAQTMISAIWQGKSFSMQLRLLRVIETMMFERVGDSAPVKTDVRIVAATNSDLRGRVATGEFREDLYYRLKVVQIDIPPLRQRRDDIPLLVEHFRRKFIAKLGREIKGISSDVEQMFLNYPWAGNVRELENLMEHAFIRCRQNVITAHDLPGDFCSYFETHPISSILPEEGEAETILRDLEQTGGNKSEAARLLGMSRRTIYRKIEKHGIPVGH